MKHDFYTVMLRRDDLLHRRAIWQEVLDYLNKFLDTDAFPATVGIRTEGSGMVVPQDRIELAMDEIRNGYMADIAAELDRIDKSEVSENDKKGKQKSKRKKTEDTKQRTGPKKDKRKSKAGK